ncbi:hypothetical protein [Agromyces sp. ZXT2-3]|uniref:hypothetical protein n=1 Tax=Agromyces sp. ZXT2-3 TaxID=3461152 RepID=UPI004054DBB6
MGLTPTTPVPATCLVELGDDIWRIVDTSRDDGDPRQIMGYLTRGDDDVEILWMRPRIGIRRSYRSMDAAVDAIERTLRERRR